MHRERFKRKLQILYFCTNLISSLHACLLHHSVPQAGGIFTQLTPPSPLENPATQSEDCAKEENIL